MSPLSDRTTLHRTLRLKVGSPRGITSSETLGDLDTGTRAQGCARRDARAFARDPAAGSQENHTAEPCTQPRRRCAGHVRIRPFGPQIRLRSRSQSRYGPVPGWYGSMRRFFGRYTWCAMVASVWLLVAFAHAEPLPKLLVDLTYEVDPALQDCPSVDELRSIVARRLGYDPYRAGSALGAEVRVQAVEAGGLQGAIDWSTGAEQRLGERRFASQTQDCRQMVTTMGFVLAVQIQLMATEPTAKEEPRPAETEPSEGPGASPKPAPSSRASSRGGRPVGAAAPPPEPLEVSGRSAGAPTPWSAMAGLGPSVGFGLGPDPIAQGRLFGAVQYGRGSIELGAEATLPSTTRLADGGGFRHQLMLGSLAACGWHRSISACALAKLGRIQVQGIGVDEPASPAGLVAQVGPRLAYSLGLGDPLVLMGYVEALYLLTPWTVHVNHVAAWTMPRFGAAAGIDLAVNFQ